MHDNATMLEFELCAADEDFIDGEITRGQWEAAMRGRGLMEREIVARLDALRM